MQPSPITGAFLCLCGLLVAAAQYTELGATWIPTDTDYAVISSLRQSKLQTLPEQIAGYGTLGVIPSSEVAAWLQQLINNPTFREGTVRWNPNDPSKCSSGRSGCTKSIRITILEFDYVNPNATDCNTTALVAADALLPPQAIAQNGAFQFWPQGPVQYQIIRSPNSTAGNCSYVVQYPQPTQTLANQLCSQQSGSCFNSSCVPCNANQSIATPANPSGCTANSGVAPALVAAIEGAAQCLVSGGTGAFQCQVAYIANASACSQMHCFPGDGQVNLEGGQRLQMQDLQIGDRVQVAQRDGSLAYDEVYFFGHRSADAIGAFIRLTLQSSAAGSQAKTKHLELSSKHFLPVSQQSQGYSQARMKQAKGVAVGDSVWVMETVLARAYTVKKAELVTKQGLWAPYTRQGTIVVNGVVASVHSEWILDSLLELLGRPDLLPALYQALLAPVRLVYQSMGASAFRKLDAKWDFGSILTSPYINSASHTLFLAVVFMVIFPLGQSLGRRFAKWVTNPRAARSRVVA